jgi:hypothetical protein
MVLKESIQYGDKNLDFQWFGLTVFAVKKLNFTAILNYR